MREVHTILPEVETIAKALEVAMTFDFPTGVEVTGVSAEINDGSGEDYPTYADVVWKVDDEECEIDYCDEEHKEGLSMDLGWHISGMTHMDMSRAESSLLFIPAE